VSACRLVLAAAAFLLAACHRADAPPPVLGEVPSFALVERSGTAFGSEQLRGRVWVANFIFTSCPDVCPALTAQMRRLDELLPDAERPARVSVSVDPARDTPEALRRYAERHGIGADWHLLTGERAAIERLLMQGFKVAFADGGPPTAPITHSDRFVLVDEGLRIRGYYHGRIPDDVERLVHDVQALRRAGAAG
jgi:protein SCO1/2